MFQDLSRIIITLGIILIIIGAALWLFGKLPLILKGQAPLIGKLPGDILVERPNFTFYAPIATMLLISLVLSIILTIISNIKK